VLSTNKSNAVPSWLRDLFYLGISLGIFYALWIGHHALFTPDEGRYSEVAREMVTTGDYITPRVNGVAFLDKPALYYWLQASAIHLFGLKEWALRFWPASIGILGTLVTYAAGRLLFNRRTGILSAIILATSPLYYGAAHYANLDLEVAALIGITLLFSLLALHTESSKNRSLFFIAAYIFCGLAALTKGLIGIAFPALIIFIWMLFLNRFVLLKKMHLVLGFIIFTATTLPWYYLVQKANPEFLHFFFVTQQFSRFLTTQDFNNQAATWFYVPIVFGGFFPWSLFMIQAIIKSSKAIFKNRQQHTVELFLLLWFIIIFIFFSIPKSKTIGYIIPVFPALSLMVGHYLDAIWGKMWAKIIYGLIIMISAGSLIFSANASLLNHKSIKPIALELKPQLTSADEVVTYYKYYQDLPLYLERRITIVADWSAPDIIKKDNWVRELWFGMPFQDTKNWLIDENIFWQRWHSNKRLFVLMDQRNYAEFVKKAKTPVQAEGTYHDVIWVSNQPYHQTHT